MGKLKDHKFGNLPLNAGWDDDYLDDEYHYTKWKKKNKKKRRQDNEYGDVDWADGVDE